MASPLIFLWHFRRILSFVILLCLWVAPTNIQSQDFNFIQYGLRQGLTQSEVTDISQGSHGYLWLATNGGGVCRFDGKQFQSFSQKDGLPSNFVNAICKDDQDNQWFGTSKGIARRVDEKFEHLFDFNFHIDDFEFLNRDLLIVGGPNGLYKIWLKEGKIIKKEFFDITVNEIKKIPQGKISVASNQGWLIFDKNEMEQVKVSNGLASNQIATTVACSSNCIWVISSSQGMTKHSIKNPQRILERIDSPNANNISSFYQNNQLWLGTKGRGYFIKREDQFININSKNGLPNNTINQIYEDKLGQKWMASAQGLLKTLERNFQIIGEKDGLPNRSIKALAEDTEGKVWVGMDNGGLVYLENNVIKKYLLDKDFLKGRISALCFDEEERLWVGTPDKGIAVLDSLGLYQIINEGRGLSTNEVKNISKDEYGNLWVGTTKGINKINLTKADSLEEFTISPIPQSESYSINDIAFDQLNQLWFASTSGEIGRLSNETELRIFDEKNGLPGTPINTITFDDQFKIWVGTAGNGVLTARQASNRPKFKSHPVNKKLSSGFINFINIDLTGDIWLGNEKGVDRFYPKEQNINVSSFGYDQGFLGGETNRNASLTDRYGKLWLGTVNGIISASTDIVGAEMVAPNIFFSDIKVQNKSITEIPNSIREQNISHDYGWDVNQINFEFRGVQLNYPQAIQYRWKLSDLDDDWSPLSFNQQVNYSNLEAGDYEFLASASCDGINFSDPIRYQFTIDQPIWKKTWFRFILITVGLLLLASIVFSRIQQIRKREKEKRQNLEIKNELLKLNQKALQLQMNPHFIFNTLNSINALVAKNQNQEARKQINNFAKQLRSTLSNSRKEYISLEKEISSLDEYLKMLQFCHAEQFEYTIINDERIQIEELEIPPMIIQPFVENAVLHGFNELDKMGQLSINFEMQGQLLVCTIEDNGIGRKAAAKTKSQKPGVHQSAGMEVTQARLDNLKGELKYNTLEIVDKTDAGEASGTKVVVKIPYRLSY